MVQKVLPEEKQKVKILVTGASGFIGGALTRKLTRLGHEVYAIVRDHDAHARPIRGDISDPTVCRRAVTTAQPDVVFHLAAQAKVGYAKINRLETMESNVRGTYNLLEAVQTCAPFAKVIVASSDKAYGSMGDRPYREDDPLQGQGIYDVSKTCTDLIARAYAESCGLEISVVRCGNVYGPGDTDLSRLVPSVCNDLTLGRRPTIMSDGTPVRDYLYIEDAVSAYTAVMDWMLARDFNRFEAWNFASGIQLSVLEMTELLMEEAVDLYGALSFTDGPHVRGERRGEIQEQRLDCTKAREVLRWSPSWKLKDSIADTLDWWYTARGVQ